MTLPPFDPPICDQCGQPAIYSPCGPTHAVAQAQYINAYAAACRAAALEEAAGICDRFAEREMHPAECAAAIRALRTSGADQQP